jgi:hypothetical protein
VRNKSKRPPKLTLLIISTGCARSAYTTFDNISQICPLKCFVSSSAIRTEHLRRNNRNALASASGAFYSAIPSRLAFSLKGPPPIATRYDQTITRLRGISRHTSAKVVINAGRCHRAATVGILVSKPDLTRYYRRTRNCLWNGTTICQAPCRPIWHHSVKRGVGFLIKLWLKDG